MRRLSEVVQDVKLSEVRREWRCLAEELEGVLKDFSKKLGWYTWEGENTIELRLSTRPSALEPGDSVRVVLHEDQQVSVVAELEDEDSSVAVTMEKIYGDLGDVRYRVRVRVCTVRENREVLPEIIENALRTTLYYVEKLVRDLRTMVGSR